MAKPEFITFTGADNWTCIDGMRALSNKYPIEWGILFSPKRQGIDPRYPGAEAQQRFLWTGGIKLSAHLCGDYSKAIMEGGDLADAPVELGAFNRIQVNHVTPVPAEIRRFQKECGRPCIAQTRGAFPDDSFINWLFDASGGRGVTPAAWPAHPGRLVGYAGGISPDNVLDVIRSGIGAAGPYWIDMESGVRTGNRFDIQKCRQVCQAVYGSCA